MAMMNAAVVTSFDQPPRYQQLEIPQPQSPEEILVDVLAAGLHPRVRTGAAGTHYTSSGRLPMVPGIDAVGRRDDGRCIYFVADDHRLGTMAEKAVADRRRSIELPDDADVARIAAAMNPAMSSWVALRRRVPTVRERSVLVLGATGSAGTMAVQVARLLGAARVIGAGRDAQRLQALAAVGVDETVRLQRRPRGRRTRARKGGGRGRHRARLPLGSAGATRDHRTAVIARGSQPRARLDSDRRCRRSDHRVAVGRPALGQPANSGMRAGLGLGPDYRAELPSLIGELDAGRITCPRCPTPLAEVQDAWAQPDTPGSRTVLVP